MKNSPPRILFLGYSEVGYECLSLLLSRNDNVVALITHDDNPAETIWFKTPALAIHEHNAALASGTGCQPVDGGEAAASSNPKSEIQNPKFQNPKFQNSKSPIPIHTPATINTPEWHARIRDEIRPDLILSVYYRNMVSEQILALPRLGAYNMHGSLLPKYRGRAPINWAVLHGEPRIGMTLHKMVKRPDAGDIIDQQAVDISSRDTAEQAFRKVLPCARAILARRIDALLAGAASATPQDESQATYFGGRTPADGRIDFQKTTTQIFNLIRAVTAPYPGAFVDVAQAAEPARISAPAQPPSKNQNDPRNPQNDPRACFVSFSARLMIWWAEPRPRPVPPPAAAPVRPGQILSLAPLVVATADAALELTRTEWRGAPAEPLRVGRIL
jgi:methionyl-tRNA formyltransferase